MTHRSKHSKFLASTLSAGLAASLLALPVLAGGFTLLAPAIADAAITSASCRIHAVEASPEGDGTIPADLEFLSDQLQAPEFARYKSFVLLDAKDFKLEIGKAVEQKFKTGHSVELSLLGGEKDRLEIHTDLVRNGTSLVNMDFSLRSKQVMLIPVRRGDSAVIFAYQCKS
jgi:hypothetical protein